MEIKVVQKFDESYLPAALSLSNLSKGKKRTARSPPQTETLYAAIHIEQY